MVIMLVNQLHGGGVQNAVRTICDELSKLDHENLIVFNDIKHKDLNLPNTYFIPFHTEKGYNELVNLIKKINCKKLFAHTYSAYKTVKKLRTTFSADCLHTVNVIHVDYYAMYYRWYKPLKNLERTFNYRKTLNNSNIYCVSKGAQDALIQKIGVKAKSIVNVPPPVNFEVITKLADKPLNETGFNPERSVVLASRLVARKNIELAIHAFSKLQNNLKLYIIGDGDQKDYLQKLINEYDLTHKVHLLGWRENPYPLIRHAKLLLSTSNIEGFGLTLVEAMLLGTPVISTDAKSGPSEILGNEYKDCLIKLNDINHLTQLLNNLDSFLSKPKFANKQLREHVTKYDITEQIKHWH